MDTTNKKKFVWCESNDTNRKTPHQTDGRDGRFFSTKVHNTDRQTQHKTTP